ncbi:MAG: hypothetical protein AAF378_12050 [Cyanobacteria bacterium P01_A01_bin.84]
MLKRLINSIFLVTLLTIVVQSKEQNYLISQNSYKSPKLDKCDDFDPDMFIGKQNNLKKSDFSDTSDPITIPSQRLDENQPNPDFFIVSCPSNGMEKS